MEFLKKLNKTQKKTIIVVTHDKELAKYADRILVLKDGQFIKRGAK